MGWTHVAYFKCGIFSYNFCVSIRLEFPKEAVEVNRKEDTPAIGYPDSGGTHKPPRRAYANFLKVLAGCCSNYRL